jgi:ankyrin repeat protein
MSSDAIGVADLQPDYKIPWEKLLQRLVIFLLGNQVSVSTWKNKEIAIIECKGRIVGQVFSVMVKKDNTEVIVADFKFNSKLGERHRIDWSLPSSAKPIKKGDMICLLQGAQKPTIIRLRHNYFVIIKIAPILPEHMETELSELSEESVVRDILLIWNWEKYSEKSQVSGKYDVMMSPPIAELEARLANPTRIWNVALILGDLEKYSEAEEMLQEAIAEYKNVLGGEHLDTQESQYGMTPLGLAARNGYTEAMDLLLAKDGVNLDLQDWYGRTPLSHAAEHGHEAVVKLLLETCRVNVNSRDMNYRTPLFYAAVGEHEAVVKLPLKSNAAVDQNDVFDQTPLPYATWLGHKAIVKLLLEDKAHVSTDKADIDLTDYKDSQSRFSVAPWNGHEAVVKQVLKMGSKARARLIYKYEPVMENGHNTHKRCVKLPGKDGPLSLAAENGLEVVVKMLLETGMANVESKNSNGQTPLSLAAQNGHEAVVKMLLETGMVNIESEDFGRTPLSLASAYGHVAVVYLLLEMGKADVDSKDHYGRTPLWLATEDGHVDVVKLLVETGKANVETKDKDDTRTPLSLAAKNGHEETVKVLLKTGKANIEAEDRYGQTPLTLADINRHEAVSKLLKASAD